MKAPGLNPELAAEYTRLFATCEPDPDRLPAIDTICERILAGRARYESIEQRAVNVPWVFVALVHLLECDLDFARHLHNGDPLRRPTVHVPANRPPGRGPWTWEESALDALRYDRVHWWSDWTVAGYLFQLEGFNGWGYRLYHPETLSPYLWGGSQHYTRGKYVADGKWDPRAVSAQIGAAVVLRRLCAAHAVALRGISVPPTSTVGSTPAPSLA